MSNPKKIKVATYPDGSCHTISKFRLGYEWKQGCYSSHMDSAIRNAKREGAVITIEPNPFYREPTALESFSKMFS